MTITHNQLITPFELDCIRFYMGDPAIVARGDFPGGKKAYNTINALLHEGIQNEVAKIGEGKKIEIFDENHVKIYVSLIQAIKDAMEKFHCAHPDTQKTSYRIDRYGELMTLMESKRIEGFYSTCKWGFLPEYAHTKANVVLMEIIREDHVPCLDFEELFHDLYAKPQEAEILLPFDLLVSKIEELPLSQEEQTMFSDMNGQAPKGKYRIFVKKQPMSHETTIESVTYRVSDICSPDTIAKVKGCLAILGNKQPLNHEDLQFYTNWKKTLKQCIDGKV